MTPRNVSLGVASNFIQYCTHTSSGSPGVTFVDTDSDIWWALGTNVQNGWIDPDWRQKVARGQDATTVYHREVYTHSPCLLTAQATSHTRPPSGQHEHTYAFTRICRNGGLINSADDVVLRDLALARLKRKLRENVGSFNSLVPAVELRELRGLVRNTAELTSNVVRTLIDIRRTRGRSAYQFAADAWLNFSFGVKPLISDTKAAAEAVASFIDRDDRSVRLTGRASKRWLSSSRETGAGGAYRLLRDQSYSGRHFLSYQYTAGIRLDLRSANNYGVSDHFGLEFGALPSVAWELIPYSWVVDYFANVGEYLEDNFTTPPGVCKYVVLSKLYKLDIEIRGNYRPLVDVSKVTTLDFLRCEPGYLGLVFLDRSKLATLPHIGMHFKTADQVGKHAVNKLLNLASVLVSGGNARRG